jgi:hypothetical protein
MRHHTSADYFHARAKVLYSRHCLYRDEIMSSFDKAAKCRDFTLHVLHASHTDVGYTDTQEKMKAHHIAFIREALSLIKKRPSFKWNCESYWCVEQFLSAASKEEANDFISAVKSGNIGLSASYLNLTDIVPAFVHEAIADACLRQRQSLGLQAYSAMTADINGYSWGYADILARQGVKRLMSSIHTHHGYHPLFRKQKPFWWQSPKGERILVWNGDHYNLGNELGIAGTPWFEYTIQDGLSVAELSAAEKSRRRIRAYVDTILEQGYEFDFAPVCVSSYMTDNAPPSLKVLDFIEQYNAEGHGILLQLSTLDEFFEALEETNIEFDTFSGDWTDWWADGVASTPADLIMYRAAARSCHIANKLLGEPGFDGNAHYQSALRNLMFYGEHTWGYSSSITEPYHPQVNNLEQWKRLYALKACESATILRESLQADYGETAVSAHGNLKFRAVNPHDIPVKHMLSLDLEHFYGYSHFEVVDDAGETVPFQLSRYSRGPEICVWLELAPKECKTFSLRELPAARLPSAGLCAAVGIDGVDDLYWKAEKDLEEGGCATIQGIENAHFSIRFTCGEGITSIYSKADKRELVLNDHAYAAFTPVYEVTHLDLGEDYLQVRRNMGRNRKAYRTKRSPGRLCDVRVLENGPLYSRVRLDYEMDGVQSCSIVLTAHKLAPMLGVDLRLHKNSVWEPENLYLSLPFSGKETWIDKAGALLRPRIDQLPGTCVDFYSVQNAVVFSSDRPVAVACQDAPLIWMGSLEAHPMRLMGEGAPNSDETYGWVMNNFWETNFKASLGGFYQFHYSLFLADSPDIPAAFAMAEALNEGVLQFCRFGQACEGNG